MPVCIVCARQGRESTGRPRRLFCLWFSEGEVNAQKICAICVVRAIRHYVSRKLSASSNRFSTVRVRVTSRYLTASYGVLFVYSTLFVIVTIKTFTTERKEKRVYQRTPYCIGSGRRSWCWSSPGIAAPGSSQVAAYMVYPSIDYHWTCSVCSFIG